MSSRLVLCNAWQAVCVCVLLCSCMYLQMVLRRRGCWWGVESETLL